MRGYDNILFDMTSQARNNYKMLEDILEHLIIVSCLTGHVKKNIVISAHFLLKQL